MQVRNTLYHSLKKKTKNKKKKKSRKIPKKESRKMRESW